MHGKPLYVNFMWHMHQPFYRNGEAGKYLLPWVRLHGTKDYYDMAAILDKYPNVHQTFNLTPVLLVQIEDYANNNATDEFLEMTLKKAEELTEENKSFILYNFFMANWDNMVARFPRYLALLSKRGKNITLSQIEKITGNFSAQEYLDLQVLFNLSWFDPMFLEQEPLKALAAKGRNFNEEDKAVVVKRQKEILSMIIPKYRQMQDKGAIEITTTPFYHPILPLLYNTDIGSIPAPGIPLPKNKFSAPEDVKKQIDMAAEFHEKRFGRRPEGMWPSEGSVCEEILPAMQEAGIKWIATDEGILEGSLGRSILRDAGGNVQNPDMLYKPYKFQLNGNPINIIFRDHNISDLIGFTYSKWKAGDAANDLVKRLEAIQNKISDLPGNHLVSIILDGENAWEYYPNDARDFLGCVYEKLNSNHFIKCVTVSEFMKLSETYDILPKLFPGSWINKNFGIWIGDEEENTAWDYLYNTRNALAAYEAGIDKNAPAGKLAALSKAWEDIYAAEGSDWNWWYGDQHRSGYEEKFDTLFRHHLMNVYKGIGLPIPAYLDSPIPLLYQSSPAVVVPVELIHPVLDGRVTDYFEWLSSGYYEIRKAGGTMHQAESILKEIYYGFDMENIYLRLDLNFDPADRDKGKELSFLMEFISPYSERLKFSLYDKELIAGDGQGKEKKIGEIASDKIIEVKIPFAGMNFKCGDEVKFMVVVFWGGAETGRWPNRAPIAFTLPSEDYNLVNWSA